MTSATRDQFHKAAKGLSDKRKSVFGLSDGSLAGSLVLLSEIRLFLAELEALAAC